MSFTFNLKSSRLYLLNSTQQTRMRLYRILNAVYRSCLPSKFQRDFEVADDENGIGKVLILKGDWSQRIHTYMLNNEIFALRLTDAFGFKGSDLSFLSNLSFLRSLEIYCWDAKGVEVIESLPQLEVLGLQFKSTKTIDFSAFLKLRVALLTWSKGLGSILELSSLEKLNIQNYPHRDLAPITSMVELKQLYLTSRKLESLNGIQKLEKLELLDLYSCPFLKNISDAEQHINLKAIEIEACNRVQARQVKV